MQGLYAHPLFIIIPRHNLTLGSHAFRFLAPWTWKSLPLRIRESQQSLPAFERRLKTYFLQSPRSLAKLRPTLQHALILL